MRRTRRHILDTPENKADKPNKVIFLVQRAPWIRKVFAFILNSISPHSKINVLNLTSLGDLDLRPDLMPH